MGGRNQHTISSPDKALEVNARGNTPAINARRSASARAAQPIKVKRAVITEQLINELHNIDPTSEMTKLRLVVKRLVDQAIKDPPDLVATKEIFDRVEGKARQQVDVTHDGDVTVHSAAISALDAIIEEAIGRKSESVSEDVVPERPVLSAPVLLPPE